MINLEAFTGTKVRGGFVIVGISTTDESLIDALGRPAIARTRIVGRELQIEVRKGLPPEELSVTIYHEILEAATVASMAPPRAVAEFNEGDFERAAYAAHQQLGPASPQNLERLLQSFGFREE